MENATVGDRVLVRDSGNPGTLMEVDTRGDGVQIGLVEFDGGGHGWHLMADVQALSTE